MPYYLNPLSTWHQNSAFDVLKNSIARTTGGFASGVDEPRYNLEAVGDDGYMLYFEVPGFDEKDLKISVRNNVLHVNGELKSEDVSNGKQDKSADANQNRLLHRGYTRSAFEQYFDLDDGIEVKNATLSKGILQVELKRTTPAEPAERVIKINS